MIYVFAGVGLAVVLYLLIRGILSYKTNIVDISNSDK